MGGRVVGLVRLDLGDGAADSVEQQFRADQVAGDFVDVPREEVAADQNS
jgi:hypothetical protein